MNMLTKNGFYNAIVGSVLLVLGIILSIVGSEINNSVIIIFRGLMIGGGILFFYGLYQIIENNTIIQDNTKYNDDNCPVSELPTTLNISIDNPVEVFVEFIQMANSDNGNTHVDWKSAAKELLSQGFNQENLSNIMLDVVYAEGTQNSKRMGAYNQIANYINISPYLTKQNISLYEQK